MNQTELVKIIKRTWLELKQVHDRWVPEWQDVLDYVARKNVSLTEMKNPESKPRELPMMYDSTALDDLKTLRYGLLGNTANQALTWLKFRTAIEKYMDLPGMRKWLSDCEKHFYTLFSKTNFYEALGEAVLDAGSIGTTLLLIEESDDLTGVIFQVKDISEFTIAENRQGQVDTIYRRYVVKLYEAMDQFDGDLPKALVNDLDRAPNRKITFIHAVFPSGSRKYKSAELDLSAPYTSAYIIEGQKDWAKVEMYETFPSPVWRYEKRSGDPWGKCPGIDAITDVKIANQMGKTIMRAGNKAVDPTVVVYGSSDVPDMNPGRWHRVRDKSEKPDLLNSVGSGWQLAQLEKKETQARIDRHFHKDLFLMLQAESGNNMTAFEVNERKGEKGAVLGTITSGMASELLEPTIDRLWEIEARTKRLPRMPPELAMALQEAGEDAMHIKVEFEGPLFQAQRKYHQIAGITTALPTLLAIEEKHPEAMDNFDMDQLTRLFATGQNIPAEIVVDEAKRDQKRAIRARMEAQAAQQQQMLAMAELAAKNQKTPEQGSLGEAVMRNVTGTGDRVPQEANQ